jgi:hypothetical protein
MRIEKSSLEIISRFHHKTAVAIDEKGQVRYLHFTVFHEDAWSVLEIPNPQGMGVIPSPSLLKPVAWKSPILRA